MSETMVKMTFNWDDESVLQLIQLFYENDILWNPKNADFKNKNKRAVALCNIARQFGTDRSEVERKLKNLTSHYLREKKKVADSRKSGAGAGDVYESKWFAYKALQFLREKYNPNGTLNDSNATRSQKDEASSSQNKRHNPDGDSCIHEVLKVLKNTAATNPVRDDASLFGDYIASKIRKMDPITTATVEHLIQNIIYQAELGNYARRPSTIIPNSPECSEEFRLTTSSFNFEDNAPSSNSDTKDFNKHII